MEDTLAKTEKKEEKVKRPEKKISVNYISSQFAMLAAGVPGVSVETAKNQIAFGHYFVYSSEVDKLIEEVKSKDPSFKEDEFRQFLADTNAVREGAAPKVGENQIRINSHERALEVANNPQNPEEVARIEKIMSAMVELRDKLNPLINHKGSCSIALKNKDLKEASEKPVESAKESVVPA